MTTRRLPTWLYAVLLLTIAAIVAVGLVGRPRDGSVDAVELPSNPVAVDELEPELPDGALPGGFRGVLVQRTTPFATGFTNDAIPDFDRQRYDTDGLWDPAQPDRLTIPEAWDGHVAIIYARGAWTGQTTGYVELKLYRNAERPIGDDQEHALMAVTQHEPNNASPFQELTSPPIVVHAGDVFTITFKTPRDATLIPYGNAATLFGAYLVDG